MLIENVDYAITIVISIEKHTHTHPSWYSYTTSGNVAKRIKGSIQKIMSVACTAALATPQQQRHGLSLIIYRCLNKENDT